MNHNMIREMLRKTPELEYTICPYCRKRGSRVAMTYLPDMSWRGIALFECPKCGSTLDKPVAKMPKLIRLPEISKVFPVS
jgi:hypothetical protein